MSSVAPNYSAHISYKQWLNKSASDLDVFYIRVSKFCLKNQES